MADQTNFVTAPPAEMAVRLALTKLRNILRLNATFSFVVGIVGVILAGPLAEFMGVESASVRVIAAGLLGVALFVDIVAASSGRVTRSLAPLISAGDLVWITASTVLIISGALTAGGAVLVGVLALVTLDLAVAQIRTRRQVPADLPQESPPVEMVEFERRVAGTPDELWPVISDHELYGRLALNLSAAQDLGLDGSTRRRECTDSAGRTWSETCTLWDPGHRFDMSVDTDNYPYPFQTVEGSWWVEPGDPGHSIVGMRFAFQPSGLSGRLILPIMHALGRPIMSRIGKGWEAAVAGSDQSAGELESVGGD